MKRAVASKNRHSEKAHSAKSTKSQQSAKVLRLKIPKKRQIKTRNLLLVCLVLALVVWSIFPLRQRSQRERDNRVLQSEINKLEAKNAKLRDEVNRLKSDDYVEQLARRDLGLVKPGETSLLVVPAKEDEIANEKPEHRDKKTDKDTSGSEGKKETKQESTKRQMSEKGNKETKARSDKSWWQRAFSFLDRLTGSKSR